MFLTLRLNIDSRNEQKSTRFERKSHDKSFEMMTNAKKVWEQLRRGDISRDEQKNLMAKMMNIIGGRVQDVCLLKSTYNMWYLLLVTLRRLFSNMMLLV
jgi:hypothetical protein